MLTFCKGTVEDDIGQSGCVPVNECPCVHDGTVYKSGESYKQTCKKWYIFYYFKVTFK